MDTSARSQKGRRDGGREREVDRWSFGNYVFECVLVVRWEETLYFIAYKRRGTVQSIDIRSGLEYSSRNGSCGSGHVVKSKCGVRDDGTVRNGCVESHCT